MTWLEAPAVAPLVRELSAVVAARYRVDPETAARLVAEALAGRRDLERRLHQGLDTAQLRRTREYKAAATAARRHVYYRLRRYDRDRPGPAPLAELDRWPRLAPAEREQVLRQVAVGHVSTLERLGSLDELHRRLFSLHPLPRSVLDVGCGRYPLLFPFDAAGRGVERYAAMDKDAGCVELLNRYARARGDGRLVAVPADVADGWPAVRAAAGVDRFDLALLLQAVPVLRRLRPRALAVLAEVPAELVVLTGAVRSMTRRERIDRRERGTLLGFAADAGWRVLGEFRTADEVGVVAAPAARVRPPGRRGRPGPPKPPARR
jgi:ribosomal RNA methyltransferase FmrO